MHARQRKLYFKCAAGSTNVHVSNTPSVRVPTIRELLAFAGPLAAVNVTAPILSSIDTAFVGRCAGTLELAALGPACMITDLLTLIVSSPTAAIQLYARCTGNEELRKRHGATCLSVALGAGLTALVVCLANSHFLLRALNATPEMMPAAMSYVRVRALGLPMSSITTIMYGLCVGQGDTFTPLVVTVFLSAVLNILFDWRLCAVWNMGIAGAAWATVAAQVASLTAYTVLMRKSKQLPLPGIRDFLPYRKDAFDVLSIFFPIAFVVICVLSMYACMSGFVNRTQPLAMVAAYKIIITVFAFVALCADPMAQTTTTKLAPIVVAGSRRGAMTFFRRAVLAAFVVGACGAMTGAVFLKYGASLFTKDLAVAASASVGLGHFVAILCLMHPMRVCQNVMVCHGDFLFYVLMQAGLSFMFFVGMWQLVGMSHGSSSIAYTNMWTATLFYYVASLVVWAGRALQLNRRLGNKS